MRQASTIIAAMIFAIAIYFMLFWGFDALRMLTSPTYGLDDVWRSQTVFGMGRYLGLGPEGLLELAAILGALKLTVAGVCAVHVVDRARALLTGSDPLNEILETGLLIAVAICIAGLAPAVWSKNIDLTRGLAVQLLLAGFAAILTIADRHKAEAVDLDGKSAEPVLAPGGGWFAPWRN